MRARNEIATGVVTAGLCLAGLFTQAGAVYGAGEPQPPVVATGQATGVTQGGATLSGTIDTREYETLYEFDLGTDTSYGSRIFGDAGREPGTQVFTAALQGLAPGTTYHFRIVATNAAGTAYGVDQTFTTAAYPSSVLSVPASPPFLATPLLAPAGGGAAGGEAATAASPAAAASRARLANVARSRRAGRSAGRRRQRRSRRRHVNGVERRSGQ